MPKKGQDDLDLWRRIELRIDGGGDDAGGDDPSSDALARGLDAGLGGLLDEALESLPPETDEDLPGVRPGQRVGAYRLESVLGTGGMGTVFLAARADGSFEQKVALKILHRSPTDPGARRRFERERQILAGLAHPHIARLLDGGLLEGVSVGGVQVGASLPYLVMEHVEGEAIDVYCRRCELGRDDRLRLVLQVCDALHYAHRRGIVHRDVKPSNLLVRPPDAGDDGGSSPAQVVVLDFGIARIEDVAGEEATAENATAEDGTVRGSIEPGTVPPFTTAGQVFGTPGYMAPEQAAGTGTDRRGDVFSVGVVLYELLTGQRPFGGRSSAEILERLRHGEPTPVAEHLPDPPPDLVTLVHRCLAREPDQRYESALALSADMEAFLDGRPIAARPVGRLERWWRQARRHPRVTGLLAAAGALAAASLLLLLVSSLRHARALEQERNAAVEARQEAEGLMDFLLADLYDGLDRAGRLDLLEQVARRSSEYYAGRPTDTTPEEIQDRAAALFNAGLVMESRGDFDGANAAYELVRRAYRERLAHDDRPSGRAQLARSHTLLASGHLGLGETETALEHALAGVELTRGLEHSRPRPENWAQRHFEGLALVGWCTRDLGRPSEALPWLEEAGALAESEMGAAGDGGRSRVWQHRRTVALGYVGLTLHEAGRTAEAVTVLEEARDLEEELVASDPSNARWREELQLVHGRLARASIELGDLAGALESLSQAQASSEHLLSLSPGNAGWLRELAVTHFTRAEVLQEQGDLDGAEAAIEASLVISRDLFELHPANPAVQSDLAWDLLALGELRRDRGRLGPARAAWEEAVGLLDAVDGSPDDFYTLALEAHLLLELGRVDAARGIVRRLHEAGWSDPDFLALCERHGVDRVSLGLAPAAAD